MGWRFRKIFNFGLFRTSVSKNGLGFSFGIPGLRYGISPDGKKYISFGIPGTGIYWIKYLDINQTTKPIQKNIPSTTNSAKSNSTGMIKNEPWWKQKKI